MDINSFSVTEHTSRVRRILGFCAVAGLAMALSACGGGGGGGGSSSPSVGSLAVTVTDLNGLVVSGATVTATVSGSSKSGTTNASGTATLTGVQAGNGNLDVSRNTFKPKTVAFSVTANQTTNVTVALDRDTKATGGLISARVLAGQNTASLDFSIQVVVVDANSSAVSGLLAPAFTFASCTPDAATAVADCVSDSSAPAFDAAYVVAAPAPTSFLQVNGGIAKPYAAALLFDQSLSIKANDPTDARLYSAREFLNRLGGSDRASLSALASGADAKIPQTPVTIYPVNNPAFVADGSAFFSTLTDLATLEGGTTPLYDALCKVMDFAAGSASVAGLDKAVIVFTDGKNEGSNVGAECKSVDESIAKSVATGVDIYTIGLSSDVDGQALAALADGGGGAFMFAEDTAQLVTIYGSLGNLLSGSLTTYRLNYRITTTVANGFANGRSVLGRLSVNTGAGIVTLPIVVRIF